MSNTDVVEPRTDPEARDTNPPAGDYAIVELMGHTTLVGRIAEVERFGTTMLAIEPLFNGELLPTVFQGGAAIYRLTPCSAEAAWKKQPRKAWQLPSAIRVIVPELLLAAPATASVHDADPFEDVEEGTL